MIKEDNEYGFHWYTSLGTMVGFQERIKFVKNNVLRIRTSEYTKQFIQQYPCNSEVIHFLTNTDDEHTIVLKDTSFSLAKILVRPDLVTIYPAVNALEFYNSFCRPRGIAFNSLTETDQFQWIKTYANVVHFSFSPIPWYIVQEDLLRETREFGY